MIIGYAPRRNLIISKTALRELIQPGEDRTPDDIQSRLTFIFVLRKPGSPGRLIMPLRGFLLQPREKIRHRREVVIFIGPAVG